MDSILWYHTAARDEEGPSSEGFVLEHDLVVNPKTVQMVRDSREITWDICPDCESAARILESCWSIKQVRSASSIHFLMARNPSDEGKVCKAFARWFDSIPRLHPFFSR
jgi:hypothetical protein